MVLSKPKVLILTDWYLPGYKAGGPIRSVQNLVALLKDDVDFSIITSDRDLMDNAPYPNIEVDTWVKHSGVNVYYASKNGRKAVLEKSLTSNKFDVFYLNSFFSRGFTIEPILLARKARILDRLILAPRGMLGEGALQLKRSKKKVFVALFKLLQLHKKVVFHATDRTEVRSMQKVLGSQIKVEEIMNVPVKVDLHRTKIEFEKPSFIFASRISPKKNLHWLIQRLKALDNPPTLNVYGESEDSHYEQKCKILAKDLPVRFHGAVPPGELKLAYRQNQFFILPTRNENFGHAIIEAMASGCPVLISDQTPWLDLDQYGAGWVIPLADESGWEKRIQMCASMNKAEVFTHSDRAANYVNDKFDFDEIRKQYLNLFRAKN